MGTNGFRHLSSARGLREENRLLLEQRVQDAAARYRTAKAPERRNAAEDVRKVGRGEEMGNLEGVAVQPARLGIHHASASISLSTRRAVHPARAARKIRYPATTCAHPFTPSAAGSPLPDCFKRFKSRKLLAASCRGHVVPPDTAPLCVLHFHTHTSVYALHNTAACFVCLLLKEQHSLRFDLAAILRSRSILQAKIGLSQHFWPPRLNTLNVVSAFMLTMPSHRTIF